MLKRPVFDLFLIIFFHLRDDIGLRTMSQSSGTPRPKKSSSTKVVQYLDRFLAHSNVNDLPDGELATLSKTLFRALVSLGFQKNQDSEPALSDGYQGPLLPREGLRLAGSALVDMAALKVASALPPPLAPKVNSHVSDPRSKKGRKLWSPVYKIVRNRTETTYQCPACHKTCEYKKAFDIQEHLKKCRWHFPKKGSPTYIAHNRRLALAFAIHGLPIALIEKETFRAILDPLIPIMSAETLQEHIVVEAQVVLQGIKDTIDKDKLLSSFALASDGWTSGAGAHYVNVILFKIDPSFTVHEFLLTSFTITQSSPNLSRPLRR